jgi:ABC-type transporter Mla subunit MlaD
MTDTLIERAQRLAERVGPFDGREVRKTVTALIAALTTARERERELVEALSGAALDLAEASEQFDIQGMQKAASYAHQASRRAAGFLESEPEIALSETPPAVEGKSDA